MPLQATTTLHEIVLTTLAEVKAMNQSNEEKRAGLFATTFLLPLGQWIIAGGAVLVAIGLTINAKIAAKKEEKGETKSKTEVRL